MIFYNQDETELFKQLRSCSEGLSNQEAQQRLIQFGSNELTVSRKKSPLVLFLNQFKDFMILILVAAAIISGLSGEFADTLIILIIILLNAIVGFLQVYRAEKAMEALTKLSITQSRVQRNGSWRSVSSAQLVPGDIISLEAGNLVPADIRILKSFGLQIDESSLTGESIASEKNSHILNQVDLMPADQTNMAFSGTLVTSGRAEGIVTSTGMQTELGKIALLLQQKEPITPLQARMTRFAKNLSYFIVIICAIIFTSGILRGEETMSVLLLAISLAVAAIPEALPALITVALSRGASRLAEKKALIKNLHAVETLGSVSYICTDKTGTLTQNKMTLVKQSDPLPSLDSETPSLLHLLMALNHDVHLNEQNKLTGEPTETAIVEGVLKDIKPVTFQELLKKYPRKTEIPFDSDRKCMTTVHLLESDYLVITKGSSERISQITQSETDRVNMLQQSDKWAAQGMRVIAYAYKLIPITHSLESEDDLEKDLIFAGLAGLIDPPRTEAKEAIEECKKAGITTVMITGDHPETAKAIAKELGILNEGDLTLTGKELSKLSTEDFSDIVEKVSVYARVSPDQKIRIVQALQTRNHFVSMTGDGVNDAPSLRSANIGVAMGINGTDVSKEAAHLILLDDNFATIVKAVKEGRRIFDNIRKFVKYIMTCNGAEIWVILLSPLLGMPVALLPIHILWINLVTDGLPALALASEQAEEDVMNRPPRATNESLFSDGVGFHIIWVGILMAAVTLGTQVWALENKSENWQTMVFTVLSLSQLGHILAVRSDRTFLYQQGFFSNRPLMWTILLTFALQLLVIYAPFMNALFNTSPLTIKELGICILLSIVVFHAVELEKFVKQKRSGKKFNVTEP